MKLYNTAEECCSCCFSFSQHWDAASMWNTRYKWFIDEPKQTPRIGLMLPHIFIIKYTSFFFFNYCIKRSIHSTNYEFLWISFWIIAPFTNTWFIWAMWRNIVVLLEFPQSCGVSSSDLWPRWLNFLQLHLYQSVHYDFFFPPQHTWKSYSECIKDVTFNDLNHWRWCDRQCLSVWLWTR